MRFSLFGNWFGTRQRTCARRRPHARFRLQLEKLEDRTLLAAHIGANSYPSTARLAPSRTPHSSIEENRWSAA